MPEAGGAPPAPLPPGEAAAEEGAGTGRRIPGAWSKAVGLLAVGTTLFHIGALTVFSIDPWLFLGCSLGLFWLLAVLLFRGDVAEGRSVA